jgi:hypothetical protein
MRKKTPLTLSPIAAADTPIYQLVGVFQRNLFFPDPSPLYALAGALVANYYIGHPVWLMLLGPPSCGKSILLNSLLSLPGMFNASEINGTPALLSGVKRREVSKDSKGGLLNEIGSHGGLVIEEFTSILSQDGDTLRKLLSAFRSIYYGRWSRNIGTEGGRKIEWTGKVAMFGGCTNVLERYTAVAAEMGERWIYYRFADTPGWAESNKILTHNSDPQEIRKNLCNGMLDFVGGLELSWNSKNEYRPLKRWEIERLIAISQFSARCRSAVPRDTRTLEILDSATPEAPMRLANTLAQLYLALEVCGLDTNESWRTIRKIGLDCIPLIRLQTLKAVTEGKQNFADIAMYARSSTGAVKRALEDLTIHQVLETTGSGFKLMDWASEIWQTAGFGE